MILEQGYALDSTVLYLGDEDTAGVDVTVRYYFNYEPETPSEPGYAGVDAEVTIEYIRIPGIDTALCTDLMHSIDITAVEQKILALMNEESRYTKAEAELDNRFGERGCHAH